MRIFAALGLAFLLSLQVAQADENSDKLRSRVLLWFTGGSLEQGPGDEVTIVLIGSPTLTDAGLADIIKPYPNLTNLYVGNTSISDAGLKHLADFKALKGLGLIGTKVTDEGVKTLGKITSLTELRLGHVQVTDEGLKELKNLKNLETLILAGTQITDQGLMHLSELKNLRSLVVFNTETTEEGEKALQKLLPEVEIVGNSTQQASGGGGQQSDSHFDASVTNPAYTDQHPAVLFDEAHDNFHTASGRYKPFADLITSDGYHVVPGKEQFTAENLAQSQILIIANATMKTELSPSAFTKDECDVVEEWVKAGGSLLLVTDHEPFGSGSKELGQRFGVDMSLRVSTDPANETANGLSFSREKKQIGDHPIMTGRNESERVDRVLTFTGQSLKGPPGSTALLIFSDTAVDVEWGNEEQTFAGQVKSLLGTLFGGNEGRRGNRNEISAAGRAQGVALEYGRGRVVVMGEAAELSAQVAGGQQFGMNTPGCDNRKMVLNIVHWLSRLTGDAPTAATPAQPVRAWEDGFRIGMSFAVIGTAK